MRSSRILMGLSMALMAAMLVAGLPHRVHAEDLVVVHGTRG